MVLFEQVICAGVLDKGPAFVIGKLIKSPAIKIDAETIIALMLFLVFNSLLP